MRFDKSEKTLGGRFDCGLPTATRCAEKEAKMTEVSDGEPVSG